MCARLIQAEPGFEAGYLGKAVLASMKGDREEAYRNLQTYRRLTNEVAYKSLQARIEAHLGNEEESSKLASEAFSIIDRGRLSDSQLTESSGYQLSYACALNGGNERFFQIAGYMVEHQIMGPGELNDPAYEKMREDPRFGELFKKLRKSYGIN